MRRAACLLQPHAWVGGKIGTYTRRVGQKLLAFVSAPGITVGRLASLGDDQLHYRVPAGDVAATPDGRVLCTTARVVPMTNQAGKEERVVNNVRYERICGVDPDATTPTLTPIFGVLPASVHESFSGVWYRWLSGRYMMKDSR